MADTVAVVLQGEIAMARGQKETSIPGSVVRDMDINQDREGGEEVEAMEISTETP